MLAVALGAMVALPCSAKDMGFAEARSPDGRNAIRVNLDSSTCTVLRDGVVLAGECPISLTVDGTALSTVGRVRAVRPFTESGCLPTPIYKKSRIDLSANGSLVDFGTWGLRLIARNDGVAYRLEVYREGHYRIDSEDFGLNVPDPAALTLAHVTDGFGEEQTVPRYQPVRDLSPGPKEIVYLPMVWTVGGKSVAFSESDVRDYPCLYLEKTAVATFRSRLQKYPKSTYYSDGGTNELSQGGWWIRVKQSEDYLVDCTGPKTLPWRTFALADSPIRLCEADLVYALASPQAPGDCSWIRPGKVAWDWWNAFDNQGEPEGCTTKTYERFIDFAEKNGIEYVIFDDGWSGKYNIWEFSPNVDVPHLIRYARARGVGIILWMAWSQAYGREREVVDRFAALGACGFKVDFIDRGDADAIRFLERFAAECFRRRMHVIYHGVTRPTGLHRMYPNILNYEGVHGLECMKFYKGEDFMFNDVSALFGRLSAGPMDYTPGAMDNYPLGGYPKPETGLPREKTSIYTNPGSEGTRCHQMAMMVAYEAYLQMLSDSPTKYERNMECFGFMSRVPVVWDETRGLCGDPASYAAVARRAGDGSWYVAVLNGRTPREITLDLSFLGDGRWEAEVFRDAKASDSRPREYEHESGISVSAGESRRVRLAAGGGFVGMLRKTHPRIP